MGTEGLPVARRGSSGGSPRRCWEWPCAAARTPDAADATAILTSLMSEERTPVDQGGSRSLLQRALFGKPLTPRRAVRLIAAASLLLALGGGVAAWLVDRDGIGTLGDSLWWALQTVTTVGYGDVVPEDTTGKLIGAVLMLNGIALVSVITAAVTAMLVEQARRRRSTSDETLLATLERIEARLAELEARVGRGT
jgi:voltage-gated potassium channel